jgi:ubiquinone/menaquinone biosynthesis C-methylase UbiE
MVLPCELSGLVSTAHQRPPVAPALLNRASADVEWANLGWWSGSAEYSDAARELARRVGGAAKLSAGDVVLDYACGFGDSLRLWIEEFGAARVVGVEPDATIAAHARARIATWGLADRITVVDGRAEEFAPARDAVGTTAVVCVDAAYLFRTRGLWLRLLARGVAPGTRLGFVDLAVPRTSTVTAAEEHFARRFGLHAGNLWKADEIEEEMYSAGYIETESTRCTKEVLDGFVALARREWFSWLTSRRAGGWRALAVAWTLAGARRAGAIDAVLISARTAR